MSSKFLDKTGLDTLWAKIKSTFQTLGNLVTAWGSTPSDTKYPSEKLVKTSLDTIPFNADFQFMTQSGTSDKCCIVKFSKPLNAYNGSNSTTVGLYVLEAYNYRSSAGPEYQSKVQLMIKITDGAATNSSVVAIDGLSGKYLPLSGFSLHVKTAVNNVVDIYLVYTTSANFVTCVGKFSRLWDVNYFTETWYKSSTSFTPFDASGDNVTKSVITDNILTKLTGFVGGTLSFTDGKPVIDTSALGTLGVEHGGTGNTSVDTAPTANSTKMVTSGGIFNALNDKATKIEFTQPAEYKSFVIIEDITRWYDPAGTAAISKGYQLIGQIAYWRSGGGYESMAVAFIKFHLNYRWQLTNDSCCEVKSTLPNCSFCPMIIRDARDENNVKYYFGLRTKIAWNSTVQFIGRTRDLSFSNLEWIPGENASHTGNGTEFPVGITIERNCDLLEWNSIANGGTGATTAIGAEYNILNQVADIDTTIDGNRKIALCNNERSATNGVFRWLKLSNVWTWIKGLLSSESGVNISGNATTATTADGYTSGGSIDTALQGKVDKETGKGLSTNDYTTADKNKVASAVQPGDLATVATSGSYDDLSDKPTIPAAQVQSDWAQTDASAVDYIKNRPRSGFISISGGSFLKLYVPANVNVGHASFRVDTSNSGSQMVAILSFRNNDGTTDRIALKNLSCGTESHQFVEGAYKVDSNGKYFYLYMGNSGTHNVTWQFTGASRNSIEVSSIPMADVPLDATAITSNSYVPRVVSLPSSPGVGSASIPVYVDTSGRIVAGTKPVQVVNSIDSSSMVSDVLYVM